MSYIAVLSGVPWDNTYAHTRLFNSISDQQTYFNSLTPVFASTEFNFVKMQGRDYVDIGMRFDQLENCNYMFFINTQVDDKWYYCFITDLMPLTRNTTRLFFQRDVMQTWMFDYTFSQCLIEREHVASSDTTQYLNPENIQIGNEYETVASTVLRPDTMLYFVIACKRPFHDGSQNSAPLNWMANHPEQLTYYIHPYGYNNEVTVSAGGQSFTTYNLATLLAAFTTPAGTLSTLVTNNIVNMYTLEYLPLDLSSDVNLVNVTADLAGGSSDVIPLFQVSGRLFANASVSMTSTLYNDNLITGPDNQKLNLYPFTKIDVYDSRGNSVTYKPEGLSSNTLSFLVMSSIGQNQMTTVGLSGYNGSTTPPLIKNRSIINTNAQDIPIITDYLSAFIQGNKYNLEQYREELSQRYDYQTHIQEQQRNNSFLRNLGNVAMGAGQAALAVKTGGLSLGMSKVAGAGLAMSAVGAAQSFDIATQQISQLSEVYSQNVASMYAKIEDLEQKPPNANAQLANFNYLMGNNLMGYTVAIKRVRPFYIQQAQQYFSIFGISTNRLGIPNLQTRSSWNYIKLAMPNIISNVYNNDFDLIKSIYTNGITLWHNNNIQNYNQSNTPV